MQTNQEVMMKFLKSITFEKQEHKNIDDFRAYCEIMNLHLDACTRQKVGIGEMYETYRYRGPNGVKHLGNIIIRDAQTGNSFVIYFQTKSDKYEALHLSPESSEVREYAYNQWKRLCKKNAKFYETSTYEI